MEFGTVTMLCLQCIVSIPISGLGIPVVHLVLRTSVNILVVLRLPSFCLVSSPLRVMMLLFGRRFELSFLLWMSRWPRLLTLSFLCGSFPSEARRRCGVKSLVVVLSSSSSFPLLFFPPRVSSWISGRDPLLVVASCNSPEIHPNLNFRLLRCCAFCLTCLRCLLHRNSNR